MKNKLLVAGLILSQSAISFATVDNFATPIPEEARPSKNFRELMADNEKEIQKKGYIESYSQKYEYLTNIEANMHYSTKPDIRETGLKKNISEVVTSLALKNVPDTLKNKTFGYAATGSFDTNHGWTGRTEIFKTTDNNLCQFTHLDLKASGGGYSLEERKISKDINGHYTAVVVTGKEHQGFDYEVIWFDDLNMYTLNCAKNTFSQDFKSKVIEMAKKIDLS